MPQKLVLTNNNITILNYKIKKTFPRLAYKSNYYNWLLMVVDSSYSSKVKWRSMAVHKHLMDFTNATIYLLLEQIVPRPPLFISLSIHSFAHSLAQANPAVYHWLCWMIVRLFCQWHTWLSNCPVQERSSKGDWVKKEGSQRLWGTVYFNLLRGTIYLRTFSLQPCVELDLVGD